jgi:hypothetical protein
VGKLGKSVVFLDPKGISQPGGNCLKKVPKEKNGLIDGIAVSVEIPSSEIKI